MKKLLLSIAVAFAAVAGTVCYNSESRNENEMSDLAKANVKALASINAEYSSCLSGGGYCAISYGGKILFESYEHFPK